MRTVEQVIEALRQPGIPRSATVTFAFSNGVANQAKPTTITLQELHQLAAAASPRAAEILGRVTCHLCKAEVTIGHPHNCPRTERPISG